MLPSSTAIFTSLTSHDVCRTYTQAFDLIQCSSVPGDLQCSLVVAGVPGDLQVFLVICSVPE